MEAPFANWFYAWDAALRFAPARETARGAEVERLGGMVKSVGPLLAAAHVRGGRGDRVHDERVRAGGDDERRRCIRSRRDADGAARMSRRRAHVRARRLRYASEAELARLPVLIGPFRRCRVKTCRFCRRSLPSCGSYAAGRHAIVAVGQSPLSGLPSQTVTAGSLTPSLVDRTLARAGARRSLVNLPDTTLLSNGSDAAFLAIVNYGSTERTYKHGIVRRPGRPDLVFAGLRRRRQGDAIHWPLAAGGGHGAAYLSVCFVARRAALPFPFALTAGRSTTASTRAASRRRGGGRRSRTRATSSNPAAGKSCWRAAPSGSSSRPRPEHGPSSFRVATAVRTHSRPSARCATT